MKNNQPVTHTEKVFTQDANILSTTNLKGAITYVNPDFIDISGFTEDERKHLKTCGQRFSRATHGWA